MSATTLETVEDQLVTKFTTALATASDSGGQVQVEAFWPGPSTENESVFTGFHPETRDIRVDATSELPTIKSGRQQRQESYEIPVTIWVFRPDLSSDGAATVRDRGRTLRNLCLDVLADDPRIGLAPAVLQHVRLDRFERLLWPFQKGWACEHVLFLDVEARLT